jgi:hypothetical protein
MNPMESYVDMITAEVLLEVQCRGIDEFAKQNNVDPKELEENILCANSLDDLFPCLKEITEEIEEEFREIYDGESN